MKYDIGGTWCGSFVSPSGTLHDLTLMLETSLEGIAAKMSVIQRKPGGLTAVFQTHVEVCGQFVSLLSKDAENGGVNAMVLKLQDDNSVMTGRIIWNSLTRGSVDDAVIGFKKKSEGSSVHSI